VNGHVLGLGNQAPVGIAQRSREVTAGIQDLRVRRAQHGLAHLLHDRAKAMLDDGYGDRIDGRAHAGCAHGMSGRIVRTSMPAPLLPVNASERFEPPYRPANADRPLPAVTFPRPAEGADGGIDPALIIFSAAADIGWCRHLDLSAMAIITIAPPSSLPAMERCAPARGVWMHSQIFQPWTEPLVNPLRSAKWRTSRAGMSVGEDTLDGSFSGK